VPRAVQRAERHDTGSRTSRNVGARPGERLADAAEIRFISEFGARQPLLAEPVRSYVICCVQRTGSWLLAQTLADTGYAGRPSDYLDDAEREDHTREWGLPPGDLAAYVHALWDKATTPNGVPGSKLMWNNFDWLRSPPRPPAGTDPGLEFMRTTFPNAQFIWLRRADKRGKASRGGERSRPISGYAYILWSRCGAI
jgi:Stf0 sulphotransferase